MSKTTVSRRAQGAAPAPQRLPRSDISQPRGIARAPLPGLMSVAEAARRLGRKEITVRRYIRRGLLRARLVGWRVFVEEKSVEWWLKPQIYHPRHPAPPWLRRKPANRNTQAAVSNPDQQADRTPPAVVSRAAERPTASEVQP